MFRQRLVRSGLAAVLTAAGFLTAMAFAGPAAAAPAKTTSNAAAKAGTLVVTTTKLTQRDGATVAVPAHIYCEVFVGDPDRVELGAFAAVECVDDFNILTPVRSIFIDVTLTLDNGTVDGPRSASTRFGVPVHQEDVFLDTCIPDLFGTKANITVVPPAGFFPPSASGTFYSARQTQFTC